MKHSMCKKLLNHFSWQIDVNILIFEAEVDINTSAS